MRKTSASTGAIFLASKRSGIGLLQVRMAGCGSRADISIDGGAAEGLAGSWASSDTPLAGVVGEAAGLALDCCLLPCQLKRPERFLVSGTGLGDRRSGRKANGRRAYAS